MQEQLVVCDNLIKIYENDDLQVVALRGLDLEIVAGEMLTIVGASGSGKSTLMNILGGLDTPTAGHVQVAGHDLRSLNEKQQTRYRARVIGQIWQQSGRNLIADLNIADNIDLPQILNGTRASRARKHTRELLEMVGLAQMAKKKPAQLSGGEQQRAALAVALANQPALLLADEPTGELDSVTTQQIMTSLRHINQNLGTTILIVTHDVAVASLMDRTIAIRDGRTSTETVRRKEGQENTSGASTIIGLPASTHEETIVIDRTGLLQLPQHVGEHLALRGRVDVFVAQDHIELWPAGEGADAYHGSSSEGKSAVIGLSLREHQEVVLVDRVGRLQLPSEVIERIPFNGRALIRLARSHVELWPSQLDAAHLPSYN
ncbi:MAG TPA: ABC transporter ATP-binding protein [Ktedonobacteraceae bacterium]|jgi:ABC-type lipoprotein export system ATPase subunit/DNA-binding transcriptional regulator/RsmH inhibitor MraZ